MKVLERFVIQLISETRFFCRLFLGLPSSLCCVLQENQELLETVSLRLELNSCSVETCFSFSLLAVR